MLKEERKCPSDSGMDARQTIIASGHLAAAAAAAETCSTRQLQLECLFIQFTEKRKEGVIEWNRL